MSKPRRGKKFPSSSSPVAISPKSLEDEDCDESLKAWMEKKFESLEERVATKDCISNLIKIIDEQSKKISQLEDNVAVLEKHVAVLRKSNDDGEQYQRRLCLRISGIDLPTSGKSESSEECLQKVREVFDEIGVDIPDSVLDRAHRIGKLVTIEGKRTKQMIVRLTTWRHRTAVYKARKKTTRYSIKLDLTRRRREIIKRANEILNDDHESFAFADTNCNLCWFRRGEFVYFNDVEDLERLRNNHFS